jgi:hypothetical protein
MTELKNYDPKYYLASIEKIDPPEGMTDGEWYHYVISQGTSKIEGKRPGTLESVTEHVEEYMENLNLRNNLGYSAYASRKPKK